MPKKFCDSRVKVLQADARELAHQVLEGYAPEVKCSYASIWEHVLRVFDMVDMCLQRVLHHSSISPWQTIPLNV